MKGDSRMNILEAKLSSEHRNDLPDSEFGLPKERKFPLNDENHVRSAITFFKYAKPNQRRELAKNINLRLKKFDMSVNVSENNPFYKYIDRKYLAESVVIEATFSYEEGKYKDNYDNIIKWLVKAKDQYIYEAFILNAEYTVYEFIKTINPMDDKEFPYFMHDINDLFNIIYYDYFHYIEYAGDSSSILYYDVFNDIRNAIMTKVKCNHFYLNKEFNLYNDILGKVLGTIANNFYYHFRIRSEIYWSLMHKQNDGLDIGDLDLNIFNPIDFPTPEKVNSIVIKFDYNHLPDTADCPGVWVGVRKKLESVKNQLENELYIINKSIKMEITNIENIDIQNIPDENIQKKIDTLQNMYTMITKDKLNYILSNNYTYELSQVDIVRLCKTEYIDNVKYMHFRDRDGYFLVGYNKNTMYIPAKLKDIENTYKPEEVQCVFKLIEVDDSVFTYLMNNDNLFKAKIINLRFANPVQVQYNTETLTEGLSINENGDIKITINPKKSYMTEYAEAHRILIENYKNKNYEAMKQNVAFMFLLISIIERDKRYKNREPEIVKARAFAINDFKTYLSYIQKNDPKFNFEQYYKDAELDKFIVNIPKETILGIKNLLKTILM